MYTFILDNLQTILWCTVTCVCTLALSSIVWIVRISRAASLPIQFTSSANSLYDSDLLARWLYRRYSVMKHTVGANFHQNFECNFPEFLRRRPHRLDYRLTMFLRAANMAGCSVTITAIQPSSKDPFHDHESCTETSESITIHPTVLYNYECKYM